MPRILVSDEVYRKLREVDVVPENAIRKLLEIREGARRIADRTRRFAERLLGPPRPPRDPSQLFPREFRELVNDLIREIRSIGDLELRIYPIRSTRAAPWVQFNIRHPSSRRKVLASILPRAHGFKLGYHDGQAWRVVLIRSRADYQQQVPRILEILSREYRASTA